MDTPATRSSCPALRNGKRYPMLGTALAEPPWNRIEVSFLASHPWA